MTSRPGRMPVLQRERRFHDEWATGIEVEHLDVARHFEGSTSPENRFILRQLGDLRGKYVLDLGCGAGEASVYFALRGARSVAADCSAGMLEVALRLAERHGVSIDTMVMDATHLDVPDNTFDVVYAANLLHHVTPSAVLPEIHRVLKPGGKACFWDPLAHNPAIKVYRMMAKEVRTDDEHPLTMAIVRDVRSLFREVAYDTFWLFALWIFIRFYLIERVHPNDERYWKKIITDEPRLRPLYCRLERLDQLVKRLPWIKRFAWNIAVVATK